MRKRQQEIVDPQPVFLIPALVIVKGAGLFSPWPTDDCKSFIRCRSIFCSAQASRTKTATSDSYFQLGFEALAASCDWMTDVEPHSWLVTWLSAGGVMWDDGSCLKIRAKGWCCCFKLSCCNLHPNLHFLLCPRLDNCGVHGYKHFLVWPDIPDIYIDFLIFQFPHFLNLQMFMNQYTFIRLLLNKNLILYCYNLQFLTMMSSEKWNLVSFH